MRDDFGDVSLDAAAHLGGVHPVLRGMRRDRLLDDGVVEESGLGGAALLELEAGEAGAELVEGAARPAA